MKKSQVILLIGLLFILSSLTVSSFIGNLDYTPQRPEDKPSFFGKIPFCQNGSLIFMNNYLDEVCEYPTEQETKLYGVLCEW